MCVCVCVCVCVLMENWRERSQDRGQWCRKVKEAMEKVNSSTEVSEKSRKDTQKMREEWLVTTVSSLVCDFPDYSFTGISHAGLANHKRQ